MMTAINAGRPISDMIKAVGIPITVAIIGLAGSVFVAALSFAMGRWAEAAGRRRDGYSAAEKTLVRYSEYCWRLRRRTSDVPEELRRLAEIGHEIQEDLAFHQLWTRAENAFVGRVFREVRAALAEQLRPACNAAWTEPPITEAQRMILGDRVYRARTWHTAADLPVRFGDGPGTIIARDVSIARPDLARGLGGLALLARSSASKDAEILMLRHETLPQTEAGPRSDTDCSSTARPPPAPPTPGRSSSSSTHPNAPGCSSSR